MRARLWLIPALMFAVADGHAAETASQAFAKLPPLAKDAGANMDCSAAEVTDKKVQAQLMPAMGAASSMSYGGSAVQMTPAQMQAMTAIGDPAFNECMQNLQVAPAESWIAPLKQKLEAKLQQVHADKIKADEAYCGKARGEGCIGDPAGGKRFNAQAAAAGTQFLKEAQPTYAKYLKDVGDCVARRDKALGGASADGPMGAIFSSTSAMTWGLLNMPAAANSSLCEAAREAAKKYLE